MSGKGSAPRPLSVPTAEFDNNWDRIFKKPDPKKIQDAENENEAFEIVEKKQKLTGEDNANTSN